MRAELIVWSHSWRLCSGYFFFSSRRRHTRLVSDWSSDVCSSDLDNVHWGAGHVHTFPNEGSANGTVVFTPGDIIVLPYCRYVQDEVRLDIRDGFKIGRASCRERV